MERIRNQNKANINMLTQTTKSMLDKLSGSWERMEPAYNDIRALATSYWGLAFMVVVFIIWILFFILLAFCCFLCNSNVKSAVLMVTSILFICVGSLCLVIFGAITMAVGGNAEIFLCRHMFDGHYITLGHLFDKPGWMFRDPTKYGVLSEFVRPYGFNDTLIDVTLSRALRECEQNHGSYKVFQLESLINTTEISEMQIFPKVHGAIDSIRVSERTLLSLTEPVQNILENMYETGQFNITYYRSLIGPSSPEKEFNNFIEQMQRVTQQIQDVATSSRMANLVNRSKKLYVGVLQPLDHQQDELIYHLTALELQKEPWLKQVNQTLIHLKNIHKYMEQNAYTICENHTNIYTTRLKSYLTTNKDTMSTNLGASTAMCRPLFNIFDRDRVFFCRNAVDYLNAMWFLSFVCVIIWSVGTPMAYSLIGLFYKITALTKDLRKAKQKGRRRTSITSDDVDNWGSNRSSTSSAARRRPPEGTPPPPPRAPRTPRSSKPKLLKSSTKRTVAPTSTSRTTRQSSVPPPPPSRQSTRPALSRENSVRSIHWDAAEDIVFQDVESGNPIFMIRDHLI